MRAAAIASACLNGPAWAQCERAWDDRFTPPIFETNTAPIAVFDDGARRMIFLSGGRAPDGSEPYAPLYWDGEAWRESPGGLTVDAPWSLRFVHSPHDPRYVFVQGEGLRVDGMLISGVAIWDGVSWTPIGRSREPELLTSGPPSAPDHLTWIEHNSGEARIDHWDGLTVRTIANGSVGTMLWYDDGSGERLCAFGGFQEFDGKPIAYAAAWDGAEWSQMGEGPGVGLDDAVVLDDGSGPVIYGQGNSSEALYRWDGAAWSTLDWEGEPEYVWMDGVADFGQGERLIGVTGAWLYHRYEYWTWNGRGWDKLPFTNDSGSDFVTIRSPSGPVVYSGGNFLAFDGVPACRVGFWDGERWSDVASAQTGKGLSRGAAALAVGPGGGPLLGNALYVASNWDDHLLSTGHRRLGALARWDGVRWESLNLDVGYELEQVPAMTVADLGQGPRLFVSGVFDPAKTGFNAVGAFDGRAWAPVGAVDDLRWHLYTIAAFDSGDGPRLYVGGSAWTRTDGPVGVARFEGDTWRVVGAAFEGEVHKLMTFDGGGGAKLYAAGPFTSIGGEEIEGLAEWDGSSWSRVGGGLGDYSDGEPPYVVAMGEAMVAGERCLLIHGGFSIAGQSMRTAAWNGSAWVDPGQLPWQVREIVSRETPHGVRTLLWTQDSDVFVREGEAWRTLTSGVDGYVRAAEFGDIGGADSIYLLGGFSGVDGVPSDGFARYGCPHCPADFDADGDGDADDAALFLSVWGRGDLDADANADGSLDSRDIVAFLKLWAAGC